MKVSLFLCALFFLPTLLNSKPSVTKNELVESKAILNNAKQNAQNDETISVYFIQRNGAFIAIQELLSSILTSENPEKQVYFYISPGIKENDANGKINYSVIEQNRENFHFMGKSTESEILTDEDINKIISEVGSSKKIDLYVEDFAVTLNLKIKNNWKYINSITFPTDGTANHGFDLKTADWLNQQTGEYKEILKNNWIKLISGEEVDNLDSIWTDMNKILPTLKSIECSNSDGSKFDFNINSWVATEQMFHESDYLPRSWNQVGTGLKYAWTDMNELSQQLFVNAYNIEKTNYDYTIGKQNIVYSGSLMNNSSSSLENETAVVVENYNKYFKTNRETNILYKPHPREDKTNLDKLNSKVKQMTGDNSDWFHLVDQYVPIEVFPLTKTFETNISTNTSFKYYMFGTSTSVQTFFESGVKEEIIEYIFPTTIEYNTALKWYGNESTVLDFKKSFIQNINPANSRDLKLTLGITLGVGIPLGVGSTIGIIKYKKKRISKNNE